VTGPDIPNNPRRPLARHPSEAPTSDELARRAIDETSRATDAELQSARALYRRHGAATGWRSTDSDSILSPFELCPVVVRYAWLETWRAVRDGNLFTRAEREAGMGEDIAPPPATLEPRESFMRSRAKREELEAELKRLDFKRQSGDADPGRIVSLEPRELRPLPETGQRVRTKGLSAFVISLFGPAHLIDNRRPHVLGRYQSNAAGHGGELWLVNHDDGTQAVYAFTEVELVDEAAK